MLVSDLEVHVGVEIEVHQLILRQKDEEVPVVSNVWRAEGERRAEENCVSRKLMSTRDSVAIAADDQIGRASCRERV